jgi:hypothetical protein
MQKITLSHFIFNVKVVNMKLYLFICGLGLVKATGGIVESHKEEQLMPKLPPEIWLKIAESGPPSRLPQVNSYFSSLPVPCNHYPKLLEAALKRSTNLTDPSDVVSQKLFKVIEAHQQPLQCFGKNSLSHALRHNVTSIVGALWSRRSEMNLSEWLTKEDKVNAFAFNFVEITTVLINEKQLLSGDVCTVQQLISKASDESHGFWRALSQDYQLQGNEIYNIAAAMSGNTRVLQALSQLNIPLTSAAFFASAFFGHKNTVEYILHSLNMFRGHEEHLEKALLVAVTRGHVDLVKLLVSKVSNAYQKRLAAHSVQCGNGQVSLALTEGMTQEEVQDMLEWAARNEKRTVSVVSALLTAPQFTWDKELHWKLIQLALTSQGTGDYVNGNSIATFIKNLGLLNMREIKLLANLEFLISQRLTNDYIAMTSWRHRIEWFMDQGIDVSTEVDEALLYNLSLENLSARGTIKKGFYIKILNFQPSKAKQDSLKAAILIRKDPQVITHLLDYGFEVTPSLLAEIKSKDRAAYTELKDLLRKRNSPSASSTIVGWLKNKLSFD